MLVGTINSMLDPTRMNLVNNEKNVSAESLKLVVCQDRAIVAASQKQTEKRGACSSIRFDFKMQSADKCSMITTDITGSFQHNSQGIMLRTLFLPLLLKDYTGYPIKVGKMPFLCLKAVAFEVKKCMLLLTRLLWM